jgi:hypothetical protein
VYKVGGEIDACISPLFQSKAANQESAEHKKHHDGFMAKTCEKIEKLHRDGMAVHIGIVCEQYVPDMARKNDERSKPAGSV